MNFLCFIFIVFLFVVLILSIFFLLPYKGNKWVVLLVLGIIFSAILCFTYHYVMSLGNNIEGLLPNCTFLCKGGRNQPQSTNCIQSGAANKGTLKTCISTKI